jgi:hypothetical protein
MGARFQKPFGRLLILILILNSFLGLIPAYNMVEAQEQRNRVIIVNAEQPNVWTLEQAHYLLAARRGNLATATRQTYCVGLSITA